MIGRRPIVSAALAAAAAQMATLQPAEAQPAPVPPPAPLTITMLVHPDMVMLDLVGPLTVFGMLGATIHLVWHRLEPVSTDVGQLVMPTASFATAPAVSDVLFVPGGLRGSIAMMEDSETLRFLALAGATAGYVTSVCTGALVLGAAGLLRDYRATTHWYVRDLLPRFGAIPAEGRVVADRNRLTGGGVTAGLDFGLALAAMLRGEEAARRIQLLLEYDPQPPFAAGSPTGAGQLLTADVLRRRAAALGAAGDAAGRAAARLGI